MLHAMKLGEVEAEVKVDVSVVCVPGDLAFSMSARRQASEQ